MGAIKVQNFGCRRQQGLPRCGRGRSNSSATIRIVAVCTPVPRSTLPTKTETSPLDDPDTPLLPRGHSPAASVPLLCQAAS
jgi:hypothetical protein